MCNIQAYYIWLDALAHNTVTFQEQSLILMTHQCLPRIIYQFWPVLPTGATRSRALAHYLTL